MNEICCGDCKDLLPRISDDSIDLIFTSPPYAERRKKCYGGVPAEGYTDWFLPIASELKRVLKPSGSFFLNIKPHTADGERSLYVFKLVIALKETAGFLFVDELCWTKNPFPGMLRGRFKNAFEPVYHFSKAEPGQIIFNPVACGTEIKPQSIARTYRKQCGVPVNGSGMMGVNTTNIRNLKLARPSNVVHANNVSNQFMGKQHHPATFPVELADFFIKSFSNVGDLVLDPFAGSGTVGVSCKKLNRNYILIDKESKYCTLAEKRLSNE